MKVLSLFDGISCARVALERAGIKVSQYYASEIDKYAIQISQKNYPDIIHVGSVTELLFSNAEHERYKDIDLLIGGSPCQDLSIAKAGRKGLDGERSGLFYEYVRILNEVKPKYFILENVASMSKESKDKISEIMGVEPIMIDASLVSAQNRKRLFWTNIPNVTLPKDKGVLLKDILENEVDKKYNVNISEKYKYKGLCDLESKSKSMTASMYKGYGNDGVSIVALTEARTEEAKEIRKQNMKNGIDYSPRRAKELVPRKDYKSNTITTGSTKESLILQNKIIRKLTPIECERLQGLPDNYTEGISNTQRYKTLGNAFNVDVVAHIIKHLTK